MDWKEEFAAMDGAAIEAAAAARRRQILGELLSEARIGESSVSQLQATLRMIDEAFPALAQAGEGGGQGTGPDAGRALGTGAPGGAGGAADGDGIGPGYVMDALLIADGFAPLRRDILAGLHTEYVLPGGRGSTKSSFVSLMLVELLLRRPGMHALVVRQVAATLRDSVYAQMRWAVEAMGLEDIFRFVPGRLYMERVATGQRVYFRGADDPTKIKSLKPPFGAIGAVWFEELDQFAGEAAVRSIEQSALRGMVSAAGAARQGQDTDGGQGGPGTAPPGAGYIFKSFNPPREKRHWVNRYAAYPGRGVKVFHSDFRGAGVPEAWLGKAFLDRAADLELRDFAAFEHEYLGVANLSGGMVFQNVVAREVTDGEIAAFAHIYNGADWGWYPDPWAFNRVAWLPGQRRLVVFCERRANRATNAETAEIVLGLVGGNAPVVCDSSEPKSISDWRGAGVMAQGAEKGPASRVYSYKWLAGLDEIVIDPERCPETLREFSECRYRMGPDGEAVNEIDAKDDHHIDAVRYALERVWKRRGV